MFLLKKFFHRAYRGPRHIYFNDTVEVYTTEVSYWFVQGVENPKSKWTSIGSPFAVFQLYFGIFSIYVVNMILFVIRKPFSAEGPCRCYKKNSKQNYIIVACKRRNSRDDIRTLTFTLHHSV